MKYTTIFEKLLCVFELIGQSWLNIAFVGIAVIFLIMLACGKLSKRKCFLLVTLACFCLLAYTVCYYYEPLSEMMNTLVNNLFTNIYFPSTYAYLFILIVTDIVAIVNLVSPKTEKIYKTIHGICFIITNFILVMILEMIAKYNIDIFSKKSLFSNTNFITLLEFSMNIFILWLVSLLVVYFINTITEYVVVARERKVLNKGPVNMAIPEVVVSNEELKEAYNQTSDTVEVPAKEVEAMTFVPDTVQNHFIPSFTTNVSEVPNTYHFVNIPVVEQPAVNEFVVPQYVSQSNLAMNMNANAGVNITSNINTALNLETTLNENTNLNPYAYQVKDTNMHVKNENTFDLSSFIPKQQEVRPIYDFNTSNSTNQIFEQILRNELPVVREETTPNVGKSEIELEKDTYTLNDYRIFNKMLKDIREHNESNSIRIDKNLEYRLITKYSTETYQMFQKMLKVYSN